MSFGFKNTCSHCSGPNIRKPTESEFKAWLPTVGLPFPFKADAGGVTELAVSDSYVANIADAVTLEHEHSLQVADSYVANIADTVTLEVEISQNLVVSDAVNINVAETVTLEQEHNLTATYCANNQFADAITLEQEHNLNVSDATITLSGESVAIEQEHNLDISDSYVSNVGDVVSLEYIGEKILVVSDGINRNESDTVTLEGLTAPVVVKRGGRRRPVYFFPQPLPKEEVKPVVYTLQVQDGIVQTTADTVEVYEVVSLRVLDGKAKVINVAPIDIRYYRSKRKIKEDELLLMAA